MSSQPTTRHPRPASSAAVWAIAVPTVLATVALGVWGFGATVSSYTASIALTSAWFVAVGLAILIVGRRRPAWAVPLRTVFVAIAAASAVGFYWTSIRDDRVDEAVVVGTAPTSASVAPSTPAPAVNIEVAHGTFRARAHSGSGTASVVRLGGGGQKLTLTDFATDNGPDLRVYLVRGPVNGDGDVKDTVDLGRLKGNIGNQQYDLPEGTDVSAYSTVVIWCRAFSVSFTQADLRVA